MEAVPELELITDHFQGVKIVPIVDEGYESLPKIPDSTISDTQDDINGYAIQSNDNLAVEKFSSGLSIHSDADGAQLNYTNTKEWPTLKESRSAAFEISQISDILATNRPLVNSNSPARKYDAVSNGLDMIEDEEEPDWVEISSEALHNISKFTAAQQAERSKNIASAWNEHTTPKGADTIEVVEEEFADEFEQVPSKIPVPISKKSTWFKSAEAQIAPYFKRSTKTSKDLITKRPHSPLLIRRIIDAVKDSSRKVAPLKQVRKAISAIPEDADEEKMGNSASEILSKEAINEKLRFESDYTVLRQLGAGGHSTVKLSLRKKDGKRFVSKCINSNNVWHWEGHVPMEIHMMKLLKSKGRSVIQYVDHFEMDKDFIIIMEYLGQDWLDLYDYVENYGPVKESNTKAIFKQIVKSVDWMHSLGISHNDIKDENVMIHPITRKIKLIDFGSAMRIQDLPVTTFYGTQKFACPESIRDGAYRLEDQETWALGTLLYVMLFKMDPFANDYEVLKVDIGDRISRVRKGTGVGDGIPITDMAYELLVSMMHKVANRRPRISEILKFAWLK